MHFNKISICLDMAGCPNRCIHCWIGHFPNGNVSVTTLKEVAAQFEPYGAALEVYSWFREPDYASNYQELWELDQQLSKQSCPQRFELLSFYKLVRDPEYVKWAYEIGVRKCQLTFFGLEEKTDAYVGRRGAFSELLQATDILLQHQIIPRWQLFANQENVDEIQHVIALSEELKLRERCEVLGETFELFIHGGSCDGENEKLYDIRLTEADLIKVPSAFHHHFGETEASLYEKLSQSTESLNLVTESPVFYITANLDVYPNYSAVAPWWHLGNLKTDGIEAILKNYVTNASFAQHARLTVPLGEMVKMCGDHSSQRLFDEDDYVMYVLNQYCKKMMKPAN